MNQSSDLTKQPNDATLEQGAVLSGDKLTQARLRERLKVSSAVISLSLSLVFLTLFTATRSAVTHCCPLWRSFWFFSSSGRS